MHVHHIALRTGDVEGLAAFYRDVLGLEAVLDRRPRSVWLALDERSVLMIEAKEPGEPPVPPRSMELVAFAVDEAARDTIREEARRRGCLDGETAFTVYLRDPDGRRVGVSTHPLHTTAG